MWHFQQEWMVSRARKNETWNIVSWEKCEEGALDAQCSVFIYGKVIHKLNAHNAEKTILVSFFKKKSHKQFETLVLEMFDRWKISKFYDLSDYNGDNLTNLWQNKNIPKMKIPIV